MFTSPGDAIHLLVLCTGIFGGSGSETVFITNHRLYQLTGYGSSGRLTHLSLDRLRFLRPVK